MKPIRYHPDAEAEMISVAAYYETQRRDLGKRFLASVQDALTRIRIRSLLYPVVHAGVRRCIVKTFPYGIIYCESGEQLVVIAVMHLHRSPGYWRGRDLEPEAPPRD